MNLSLIQGPGKPSCSIVLDKNKNKNKQENMLFDEDNQLTKE
jgi:hypothetical protein